MTRGLRIAVGLGVPLLAVLGLGAALFNPCRAPYSLAGTGSTAACPLSSPPTSPFYQDHLSSPSSSPASGVPTASPPCLSPSPPSPEVKDPQKKLQALVERIDHLNPSLKDYSADVKIHVSVKLGLLRVPMDLQGACYYKQPDKYKMELKNAPSILQKYPQVFGYQPVNPTEYTLYKLPDETVNGRPCHVLRLDKKPSTSDFRGQTLWIDQEHFTSPRRLYHYIHDGRIDVRLKWRQDQAFWILDQVEGLLDFPRFSAHADVAASYGGYRFNFGLDDNLFVQGKRK